MSFAHKFSRSKGDKHPPQPKHWLNRVFGWLFASTVLVAGLLNAGGIAAQAKKTIIEHDVSGMEPFTWWMFLFIQVVYAANGYKHQDRWQVWGMTLSAIPTTAIIIMIYSWR